MKSMEESLFQDLETSHGSDDDSQEDADTLGEWETVRLLLLTFFIL